MASIAGLAAQAAALGPRTAWVEGKTGQAVDVGIPGPVEDTNPEEESRTALVGSPEAGNLAGLRAQNADSVEEGSIGESTVAVETSVDFADELVAAEIAAAVAVDLAGFAVKVEEEVAAAGSELAASTKEGRSGEHSACDLWLALWQALTLFAIWRADLVYIRRKATEFSTRFCALGGTICDLHPRYFIT